MAQGFDRHFDRHGTDSIKWDLTREDELPMFIADMDFESAPAVKERIENRLKHPVYGYTRTPDELIESFIYWFKEEYDFNLEKEWVVPISGIVPALAVVSNLGGGSSITVTPNYHMLLDAPEKAGNKMIKVPLRNDDEYYTFDFDALSKALLPDTKLFYLCNPQNPVGRIYKQDELEQVSSFAKDNDLIVISDEIHCELVYDRKHIPFVTVNDQAKENSISFYAPGKTYNIPGVSLAFAVIPNEFLRKEFNRISYALGHPGVFNIEAGIAAYSQSKVWRLGLIKYLKENRDYLKTELKRRFPDAVFTHTEATYLQWIKFGKGIDAEFLRKNAKVWLTDGKDFGGEGYVRLNFGCPRDYITEALDRIERVVSTGEEKKYG